MSGKKRISQETINKLNEHADSLYRLSKGFSVFEEYALLKFHSEDFCLMQILIRDFNVMKKNYMDYFFNKELIE